MDFVGSQKTWTSKPISYHVDGIDARGGASLLKTENNLFLFGGADRGQCHFSDLWMYQKSDSSYDWFKGDSSGDVPTPRSGHATVLYDGAMLLFGGIDYSEEAVYNDLYCLDLETLEWKYVGEAGEEVIARNSHSLGVVLGADGHTYLVIYGGASPSEGPLGDTYYANLSDLRSGMFVNWIRMEVPVEVSPGQREMHSTCCYHGRMYIAGGRNETEVLSDIWCLGSSTASSAEGEGSTCPLLWTKLEGFSLDTPRCAHGGAIIPFPSDIAGEPDIVAMCLFGGFTGAGVSADLIMADITPVTSSTTSVSSTTRSICPWKTVNVKGEMPPRFGLAMCVAPNWVNANTTTSSTGVAAVADSSVTRPGLVIFGGVNAERDLNDFWLLQVDK